MPILFGIALLLLGGLTWLAGAALADTALLSGSAAAQSFFISLLATMQWSGRAILLVVGSGLALASLIELLAWPAGRLWRQAGALGRSALALFWGATVLLETILMAWGANLWGGGLYYGLFGAAPAWGLWVLALPAGLLLALAPEWLWRSAVRVLKG